MADSKEVDNFKAELIELCTKYGMMLDYSNYNDRYYIGNFDPDNYGHYSTIINADDERDLSKRVRNDFQRRSKLDG